MQTTRPSIKHGRDLENNQIGSNRSAHPRQLFSADYFTPTILFQPGKFMGSTVRRSVAVSHGTVLSHCFRTRNRK